MTVGGLEPGTGYSQLVVHGVAALGGTLAVAFTDGFQPQPGDQYELLRFSRGQGRFSRHQVEGASGTFLFIYDRDSGLTLEVA